jgi:transposase
VPDVSSNAPGVVRMRAALDVHKRTIVCASQPDDPRAGELVLQEIPNGERAIRALIKRLGGPDGLVVCYEAGPCGYDLFRLLSAIGVACDVVAPALTPIAPGARVKTDRRDAQRLLVLYRAGALKFVAVPTREQEGLRDLVRCREDLVCARRAARHRVAKALLRHGHIFAEAKKSWTKIHQAWVRRQRLADPLAQCALEHMLAHLDSVDAQIAVLDHQLEEIAGREPWNDPVSWLCCFRGISTITALGMLAELGDFHRFATARELMGYLGLTPSEYSSGEQRHRGHITKTGPRHARRLLIEAAWHYQHPPRISRRIAAIQPHVPPAVAARAHGAQIRLHHRHRTLTAHGKRSTVANVAVARELAGFLWAAMTHQPLRDDEQQAAAA